MSLLNNQRVLAVKVESVKGTAETLQNSDAVILAEDVRLPLSPEPVVRAPLNPSLSKVASIAGAAICELTCRVELKHSGTATTPPSIGRLLRICGFTETVNTANVTYALNSADASTDTGTLAVYVGAGASTRIRKMYGARGNVDLQFAANGLGYGNFTIRGIYNDDTDGSMLTQTLESSTPVKWENAQISFGTFTTSVVSSWSLNMNNTVVVRPDANATYGLSYAMITNRDPGGTINPDSVLVATKDWSGIVMGSTLEAFSARLGAAAGNTVTFSAPKLQVLGVGDVDEEGVLKDELTFALRKSAAAGDDELTIVFS